MHNPGNIYPVCLVRNKEGKKMSRKGRSGFFQVGKPAKKKRRKREEKKKSLKTVPVVHFNTAVLVHCNLAVLVHFQLGGDMNTSIYLAARAD